MSHICFCVIEFSLQGMIEGIIFIIMGSKDGSNHPILFKKRKD